MVAVESGFQRGAGARRPTRHANPGSDYRARRFVPQHHGIFARRIAHGSFGVRVDVGAADPYRVDPHLHLARPRLFDLPIGQAKFARSHQFGN